uniref:Secreted protein n=1 Tax=Caenorhabditis tropicalis TaxID=1561998 RepID=A0A1I7UQS9_9PELO
MLLRTCSVIACQDLFSCRIPLVFKRSTVLYPFCFPLSIWCQMEGVQSVSTLDLKTFRVSSHFGRLFRDVEALRARW